MSPGRSPSPPWRARKAARPVPARKHRSCESGLEATGSSCSAAIARTCGLLEVAEREAQPRERRARQAGEHVGLVLGRVGGQAQQPLGRAAGVVAGGQRRGAEAVGEGEHGVQAHVAVAAHARVGRQPGGVIGQPRLDDAGAELVAQVEGEVRKAHAVGEGARAAHRAGRAARALGVVVGVAPELERHGRGGRPAAQRGDRRVDAAAHGHERALRIDRRRVGGLGIRHRAPERARERVGGELGRVELSGAQAAEGVGDRVGADARGVEDAGAAHELDGGAARGDGRAAARRLEAGVGHAVAVDRDRRCARDRRTGRRRPRRHGRARGRGRPDGAGAPRSARRAPGQCRPSDRSIRRWRSSRGRGASWRRRCRRRCRRSRAARA